MNKVKENSKRLTLVRFVYYDDEGAEYWATEREMYTVPAVGDEIYLDRGDQNIDMDGWTVEDRVCDLGHNCWIVSIEHRRDDERGEIWRFKEEGY